MPTRLFSERQSDLDKCCQHHIQVVQLARRNRRPWRPSIREASVVGKLGFNYEATSRCEGLNRRVSHEPASLRLSAEAVGDMHSSRGAATPLRSATKCYVVKS